jgi:DUF2938 family protein
MELLPYIILTGIVATLLTDAWAAVRQRLSGARPPNYGLVGRWIAHLARGRFRHATIAASPAVHGESLIGWAAHYLIGIAFAALLPVVAGRSWFIDPTLLPALLLGLFTVLAPFLVMQPGMGAGIAASRTPRPGAARLQSLVNHAVFGIGLFVGAEAATKLPGLG